MKPSRRRFLRTSATAASAFALTPLGVAQQTTKPAVPLPPEEKQVVARPVPIQRVRLLGGPLKVAQDRTAAYLLSLNPDRMMSFYRTRAGLKPKAEGYGGADGPGRNLTGHIAGHHLSGVSLMFLATGDARFKERAGYLVREMKEVQDANGDGYCGAIEGGKELFAAISKGDIKASATDLNGLWSPWYTLHKTFAGLRDAYRHTGNKVALDVEIKFAGWAENVLRNLSNDQVQRMLVAEFGGMGEVLADLYGDTGDRRWLALSYRFEHRAATDRLRRHQDNLSGKHCNSQVAKLIASATRHTYTGDASDIIAAAFFWDRVVQHHSYVTGGHGLGGYFGAPDKLNLRVEGRTAETCSVHNMVKLTRQLFSLLPDAIYADFLELALFNHILASIDPEDGRTSNSVPVGRGVQQDYVNMQESFTCCVGSSMEIHAQHGDGIYYESVAGDKVWVNLFVPSTATLASGVALKIDSSFPDGDSATITVTTGSVKPFTLAVRRPAWAGDDFVIKVNGTPELKSRIADRQVSTYVELLRTWKAGDVVELTMPKALRLEPTPDNPQTSALMWGPLVLAGDHGPRREGGSAAPPIRIPALVAQANRAFPTWVNTGERPGDFIGWKVGRVIASPPMTGAQAVDVPLAPMYRTHRRTYSVYFDVLTTTVYQERVSSVSGDGAQLLRIEAATVGRVQIGDAASERNANYQSGAGWFSVDLPVVQVTEMALLVKYVNDPGQPAADDFEVQVGGTKIGGFVTNETAVGPYEANYPIPTALTLGKSKVTVRFQVAGGGRIAPISTVRMVRAAMLR